ncbi:MAG: hypothetical protein KF725_00875 [Cyclobacteriaceae bacterium]|nr:hypothetical protein [Cyclobacteriaceae bacterium]UYN86988.1 MAG: hypothetical protein KIT51_01530 [Cyclobacteriaceae bacterium]
MKIFATAVCLGICVIYLASCSEISYKEPQPKGIKSLAQVPAKLQGKYLIMEEGELADTLIVMPGGYKLGKDELAMLSDSLVMKHYKGYYFINLRNEFSWYLRVVKQQKNGDLLYLSMPEVSHEYQGKKFRDQLAQEVTIVETEVDGKTFYLIDPSPKKLIQLIQKGYFNEQTFQKVK